MNTEHYYLYSLVSGMGYYGNPHALKVVRAALPGLRERHPDAEIERVLTLPSGAAIAAAENMD